MDQLNYRWPEGALVMIGPTIGKRKRCEPPGCQFGPRRAGYPWHLVDQFERWRQSAEVAVQARVERRAAGMSGGGQAGKVTASIQTAFRRVSRQDADLPAGVAFPMQEPAVVAWHARHARQDTPWTRKTSLKKETIPSTWLHGAGRISLKTGYNTIRAASISTS
jgi:hypothetical protein